MKLRLGTNLKSKGNDEIRMTKLEGMTNDQMTNSRDAETSSFWIRASFIIRHSSFVILPVLILMVMTKVMQAQSPNLIGRWNIEITFPNDEHRSLRFEAQDAGKGSLLLVDPRSNVWQPARPSEAKWTRGEGNSVTFSGLVEFMIGNVGRDAGTLAFKGKFETADLITGEVEFSPVVGERPSKHGTFKAVRAGGG
jgi:hypothetical protein